jgi:septal ring factor EnvC (AmiA/AmiB activator)
LWQTLTGKAVYCTSPGRSIVIMPIITQDAIEQMEAQIAELQDEIQSYADELAEKEVELRSLKAQIDLLIADRSVNF